MLIVKKEKCYTFIADESTDVGVKEQISLCARFVDKKEDDKHYVQEDFLTFVHAENGTTADALATQFLDALNKIGVPVDKMRAQCYDGASVTSGHIYGGSSKGPQSQPKGRLHPLSCPCVKSLYCSKHNGHNAGSFFGIQVLCQAPSRV